MFMLWNQRPFAGLFNTTAGLSSTYSEVLASPKPLPSAIGGLFSAGVLTWATIEHAVPRVAAKEGVGQGRLSSSSGPNYDDPGVGKVRDKRPLTLGQRKNSQEEKCCLHGHETNTTAQDKLFVQLG